MKNGITATVMFTAAFLVIGIVGGIERGASIANALFCLPLMLIAYIAAKQLEKDIPKHR